MTGTVLKVLLSIVFAAVGLGLGALIHLYIWRRLVRDTGVSQRWRRPLAGVVIGMALLVPLVFLLGRVYAGGAAVVGWPAFLWMAFSLYLILALAMVDTGWLARRVAYHVRKQAAPPVDPQRRAFIARMTGGAAVAVAGGTTAVGIASALSDIAVVEVEIPLAKLPAAMDGFVIAQLTDLHAGFTLTRPYVQGVVDRINALAPDLVALTGDLVDGTPDRIGRHLEPLGQLRSRHGSFAVTGNHEYLAGVEPWLELYRRLGIRVLRNERVDIRRGDAAFDLAGVDDYQAHLLATDHRANLDGALAGRDPERELVLLAHQPREVRRAKRYGVGLQLSGHTHGGQLWPWHYLVMIQQGGLLAGKSRHGDTWLYVSRGCGYWGPPVRVGAPPEITKIVLRRAG